jgi:hypothetical protein
MERIDAVESASVNETHEQITDVSPVFSPIKETVLPMENCPFENLFTEVIIQGCPWNSQKEGERFPMLQHIGDGLSHGGVRFDLPIIELFL